MANKAVVRGLAGVIALLLVISGVALVSIDDDGTSLASAPVGGESAEESAPPPTPAGGVEAPGDPGAAATPQESDDEAPAAAAGGNARRLPEPGTYRYRQSRTTTFEFTGTTGVDKKEEEVTRRIERVSETPDEVIDRRHTEKRTTSTGEDGSGSSSSSYEERSWRSDGVRLRTEVTEDELRNADGSTESSRSECDWQPDVLQIVLPLQVGRKWSWDSTCSQQDERASATSRNSGSAEIVRSERRTVGGTQVETFVIEAKGVREAKGELRSSSGGKFESRIEQSSTSWFAADHSVPVRVVGTQVATSTFENPNQQPSSTTSRQTQEYESDLVSLKPS